MPIDKKTAIEQIDVALGQWDEYTNNYRNRDPLPDGWEQELARTSTRIKATIDRLAPPGTVYRNVPVEHSDDLVGTLKCLRDDYDAGYLQTFTELIHGETFSDFLAMAEHLLSEAYKDAAAVIAGGVLEQHLRALCAKHGVPPTFVDGKGDTQPKMINAMNTDLYKAGVYAKNFMQQITAWATIRNDAAHGDYTKVDRKQVELMVSGLRHFMLTHSA